MDNEKLTVWGNSYEKEMEAMLKTSDSTLCSQMDISAGTSTCEPRHSIPVANKENVGPPPNAPNSLQYSFALLQEDLLPIDGNSSRKDNQTNLHAMPSDFSNEDPDYGDIFQLRSFMNASAGRVSDYQQPSVVFNEMGTEVSMMWQDIMSETKLPGNKMPMINDANVMEITGKRASVLRTRETIYDGQMDLSMPAKTVIVQRNVEVHKMENYQQKQSAVHQQTVHFDAADCELDESINLHSIKPKSRETIHYEQQSGNMDISRSTIQQTVYYGAPIEMTMVDKENYPVIPKGRRTIHEPAVMDESVCPVPVADKENLVQQGAVPKTQSNIVRNTRQTIVFNAENDNLDESVHISGPTSVPSLTVGTKRQTVHYNHNDGQMDESIQIHNHQLKSVPPSAYNIQQNKNPRQTIYAQENMDESTDHNVIKVNQQRMQNPRQTIHFNDGGMDESIQIHHGQSIVVQKSLGLSQQKNPRHTVYAQDPMEESVVIPSNTAKKTNRVNSRQTIVFNQNEGGMDESIQIDHKQSMGPQQPSTQLPKPRQTIYAPQVMDESIVQPVTGHTKQNPRQTIHFNPAEGGMDESMQLKNQQSVVLPPSAGYLQQKNSRKTVYAQDPMDESIVVPSEVTLVNKIDKKASRQTIVFDQNEGGMDESIQINHEQSMRMSTVPVQQRNTRQTVHYNPNDGGMDESIQIQRDQTLRNAPVSIQQPRNMRQTIYDQNAMDESYVSKGKPQNPRQTIHYNPNNCGMDESIQMNHEETAKIHNQHVAMKSSRQTVYTQDPMDESIKEIRVAEGKPLNPRQTINFNANEGCMDESIQIEHHQSIKMAASATITQPKKARHMDAMDDMDETITLPVTATFDSKVEKIKARQTIHYDPNDGGMDESIQINQEQSMRMSTAPVQQRNTRQTIHYNPNDGGMDESICIQRDQTMKVPSAPNQQLRNTRQTIYYQDAMNESCVSKEKLKNPRQTIHFNANDGKLDESIQINQEQSMRMPTAPVLQRNTRQTVYNQENMDESNRAPIAEKKNPRQTIYAMDAMDESIVLPKNPQPSNARQTIHYNPNNGGMEESILISKEEITGEPSLSAMQRKSRQTIHNEVDMDESTVGQENIDAGIKPRLRSGRQTIYYSDGDKMEESMAVSKTPFPIVTNQVQEIVTPLNVDEDAMDFEEGCQKTPGKNRGTFVVQPEQHQQSRVSLQPNATLQCDSNLSDLNNTEDSIQLLDSQDVARPMSRANMSQRMSLASPLLPQDETVNDLILNFNMTGHREVLEEEQEEEDELEAEEPSQKRQKSKETSKIPVLRTPRKLNRTEDMPRDLSPVDIVCRDAPGMVFEGAGAELNFGREITFIEGKNGKRQLEEIRMSIPEFHEQEMIRLNNSRRQTMLELEEELRDNVSDDQEEEIALVPQYRELNVQKINEMDFDEGKKLMQMMKVRIEQMVDSVKQNEMEQSLYLSRTTVEDKALKENIWAIIKE